MSVIAQTNSNAVLPGEARLSRSMRKARVRGLTLIEILVVLVIIAVMTGAAIAGSGAVGSARLKEGSTLVASAVRAGYARANATSRSVRLVMDFSNSQLWLEEGDRPMLIQSKDLAGGAESVTDAEKFAQAEGERIVKGPTAPKARFVSVPDTSGNPTPPKPLPTSVMFKSVQTDRDEEARTEGRAYVYFWPGGRTERCSIQLKNGGSDDSAISIIVSPLTGKAAVKRGAVPLEPLREDKGDREDQGI